MNEDDTVWLGDGFRPLKELAVADVVKTWFENNESLFEVCAEVPEIAWPAILEILQRGLCS